MQFLSVTGRELRVAARKRSSFTVRLFISAFALLLCALSLWVVTLFGAKPISGEQLFFVLSRAIFIFACLGGAALSADSVNEERNDGTLGLLFLTNLHPVSIALGKLAGKGLIALYSILATVPVMALPALMGGADAESLVKTALVLLATLALSLNVGMFASTMFRQPWAAAAAALFLLSVLAFGMPVAAIVLRLNQQPNAGAALEVFSPWSSLSLVSSAAAPPGGNRLGLALAVELLLALAFFCLVVFALPRVWKEGRSENALRYIRSARARWRYGTGEGRRKLRTRLLQLNPILWLSCRERFGPVGYALVLLVPALAAFWLGKCERLWPVPGNDFLGPMAVWIGAMPVVHVVFCFRLAAASSERFAVDRKAGALELILCAPLETREIVRGHWMGLVRRFWGSAVFLLALHAFTLNYIVEAIRIEAPLPGFSLGIVILGVLKHLFGANPIPGNAAPFYIICLALLMAAILIVVLWIALVWLGMALSLKIRREILAPWASLLVLAAPPIPLFIGAVALLNYQKPFVSDRFLVELLVGATGFSIVLANALFWLLLARRSVLRRLRDTPRYPSSGRKSLFPRAPLRQPNITHGSEVNV